MLVRRPRVQRMRRNPPRDPTTHVVLQREQTPFKPVPQLVQPGDKFAFEDAVSFIRAVRNDPSSMDYLKRKLTEEADPETLQPLNNWLKLEERSAERLNDLFFTARRKFETTGNPGWINNFLLPFQPQFLSDVGEFPREDTPSVQFIPSPYFPRGIFFALADAYFESPTFEEFEKRVRNGLYQYIDTNTADRFDALFYTVRPTYITQKKTYTSGYDTKIIDIIKKDPEIKRLGSSDYKNEMIQAAYLAFIDDQCMHGENPEKHSSGRCISFRGKPLVAVVDLVLPNGTTEEGLVITDVFDIMDLGEETSPNYRKLRDLLHNAVLLARRKLRNEKEFSFEEGGPQDVESIPRGYERGIEGAIAQDPSQEGEEEELLYEEKQTSIASFLSTLHAKREVAKLTALRAHLGLPESIKPLGYPIDDASFKPRPYRDMRTGTSIPTLAYQTSRAYEHLLGERWEYVRGTDGQEIRRVGNDSEVAYNKARDIDAKIAKLQRQRGRGRKDDTLIRNEINKLLVRRASVYKESPVIPRYHGNERQDYFRQMIRGRVVIVPSTQVRDDELQKAVWSAGYDTSIHDLCKKLEFGRPAVVESYDRQTQTVRLMPLITRQGWFNYATSIEVKSLRELTTVTRQIGYPIKVSQGDQTRILQERTRFEPDFAEPYKVEGMTFEMSARQLAIHPCPSCCKILDRLNRMGDPKPWDFRRLHLFWEEFFAHLQGIEISLMEKSRYGWSPA